MENMKVWNAVKQAPPHALKKINFGRLKGMSDINPQWRMQALTEQFGPAGIGWRYEITRLWTEPATDGQVFAFSTINLYVKDNDEWCGPVAGVGGSMLIKKEKAGLHNNDEAYKMATTDAIGVACKSLGIAADVYAGLWDGTKYVSTEYTEPKRTGNLGNMTNDDWIALKAAGEKAGLDETGTIEVIQWVANNFGVGPKDGKVVKHLLAEGNFLTEVTKYNKYLMSEEKDIAA